jgi:hypothetical protein
VVFILLVRREVAGAIKAAFDKKKATATGAGYNVLYAIQHETLELRSSETRNGGYIFGVRSTHERCRLNLLSVKSLRIVHLNLNWGICFSFRANPYGLNLVHKFTVSAR